MAANDKWYFTKEQLENSPSKKSGCDGYKELGYRQQAANFIQNMGQRLKVSQLCINTAIVYMHRFYVFHSFTKFAWHQVAAASLFLAAKVEEQPRKLEYVIRIANACRYPRDNTFDINSERYLAQSQDLVFNENVLLQTLGFDVAIDHPHTHVVRCCQLVRASKDLAQTSYFMASNSLHLTTMCLQYRPTVVACFCIHLACKWSNWEIPLSNEKKEWFSYVDNTVTLELLQQLTEEFLSIFASCPSKLKEKIMSIGDIHGHSPHEGEKRHQDDSKEHGHGSQHDGKSDFQKLYDYVAGEDKHRSRPHDPVAQREREYREKKEREGMNMGHSSKPAMPGGSSQKPIPHGHHRHPQDPKAKSSSAHQRPPSSQPGPTFPSMGQRPEPRDILREAARDSPFGIAAKDAHHHKEKHGLKPPEPGKYPGNAHPHDKHRSRPPDHGKVLPGSANKYGDQVRSSANRTHDRIKQETENIKKHLNAGPVPYMNKPPGNATVPPASVQKVKSPYGAITETPKSSVPKSSLPNQPMHMHSKMLHHHNGSSSAIRDSSINGSYAPQTPIEFDKTKTDISHKEKLKEDPATPPQIIKRPSLFSPEKTPPHQQHSISLKTSPDNLDLQSPSMAPIFNPPVETPTRANRSRNFSTSSEPELRPVMKKIDQVEGFENLQRETTIGINKLQHNSDVMGSKQEEKSHNLLIKSDPNESQLFSDNKQSLVNGIETNPMLISSLLKETPAVPHLNAVTHTFKEEVKLDVTPTDTAIRELKKEHHHHKSKKKNKEKHKHKDKDREKDREKKKKHKDKDREKHKNKEKSGDVSVQSHDEPPKPLVIKIQKDKIQALPEVSAPASLKIKIPKDKIKTEGVGELAMPTQAVAQPALGGLKIKISKEVISAATAEQQSRKRDRSANNDGPPMKVPKNGKEKQNGRHSMHKAR